MEVVLKAPGVERRWTLLALDGCGPEIPTLAAALLGEEMLAGRIAPGARDAGGLLTLAQFETLFAGLAIRTETVEQAHLPVYARAMGERYAALPAAVREMHALHGDGGAAGEGTVERGTHLLARLMGAVVRFPPSGTYPLHVSFSERDGKERWTREFGPHAFTSELSIAGEGVAERFGLMRFAFALPSDDTGLRMVLKGWTMLGVPMPLFLAPRIIGQEWEEDGRFRYLVEIDAPVIGKVVRYTGWLVRTQRSQRLISG
jgi:hypothetical protein